MGLQNWLIYVNGLHWQQFGLQKTSSDLTGDDDINTLRSNTDYVFCDLWLECYQPETHSPVGLHRSSICISVPSRSENMFVDYTLVLSSVTVQFHCLSIVGKHNMTKKDWRTMCHSSIS